MAAILGTMLITAAPQLSATNARWVLILRSAYVTVWPQGWSFFADAPRKDVLVTYYANANTSQLVQATEPLMSRTNYWGVSRSGDGRHVEARRLASKIPETRWRACGADSVAHCPDVFALPEPYALVNRSEDAYLCGRVIFAVERPRQWMVRANTRPIHRIVLSAAVANVECVR